MNLEHQQFAHETGIRNVLEAEILKRIFPSDTTAEQVATVAAEISGIIDQSESIINLAKDGKIEEAADLAYQAYELAHARAA